MSFEPGIDCPMSWQYIHLGKMQLFGRDNERQPSGKIGMLKKKGKLGEVSKNCAPEHGRSRKKKMLKKEEKVLHDWWQMKRTTHSADNRPLTRANYDTIVKCERTKNIHKLRQILCPCFIHHLSTWPSEIGLGEILKLISLKGKLKIYVRDVSIVIYIMGYYISVIKSDIELHMKSVNKN